MSPAIHLDRWLLDDDVAQWVEGFLNKMAEGREIPAFGSDAWRTAEPRMQIASAVRAGEAWRRDHLLVPVVLADEMAAQRYWQEAAEAAAFVDVAAKVRAMADSPTHAQLVERRAA